MRSRKRAFLLLGSLLSLCGCSPASLLNFTIPTDGYVVHHDIAYAEGYRHTLDIYVPDHVAEGEPVILFFYGGSWQMGGKNDYLFVGQALASQGFITVIADYGIYPPTYFPEFMEDCAEAFVWTHNNIAQYGGNPKNLFLAGHSAGAYNAVMLAVNDAYIKGAGGKMSWIRGTMGIAGPYDFLPLTDPKLIELFSLVPLEETQPINFVKAGVAPMMLAYGDDDSQVYPRNSIHLEAKLKSFNDQVVTHVYPDVGHIGIVVSLAKGFRRKTPLLQDITDFVETTSKKE